MKKTAIMLIIVLLLPASSVPSLSTGQSIRKTNDAIPGEIIALSCSDPYPTVSEPVYLIVTVQGSEGARSNETIVITDEFSGLVATDSEMMLLSGSVTIGHYVLPLGLLPRYTKKIAWYPSVAGNHSFHIVAGAFAEKHLNVSVGFDVEGIIAPSLGCPALVVKSRTNQFSVTLSEERNSTDEPAQILQVELFAIDGDGHYSLDNQTSTERTWLNAGTNIVEDELITEYSIETIPDGFYNLSVTTAKKTYTWPHAVKIQNTEPTDYKVVQLTDTHIGKYANFVNKKKELIRLMTYMNEVVHPDFVILTGDSIDWHNQKSRRNVYADLQEALLSSNAPVYITPGNHERYGNSLLFFYTPFTNLTAYHRFLAPVSDYSFHYGGVNFVFLDSGYDFSRWEIQPQIWNTTPEGSGLTNTQMYLLENTWGDAQIDQIISMHHPAVNDKNDTALGALPNNLPGGNDECIAFNRAAFISYCFASNVSLVLTGHTHENRVFNDQGKDPSNYSAWPLFIQTASATMSKQNDGGRIIHVNNSAVLSYEYVPFL